MRLPAVLLTLVYVAALAVALRDPSEHLVAGAVVLTALLVRLRPSAARSVLGHVLHPRRTAPEEVVPPAVVPATPA